MELMQTELIHERLRDGSTAYLEIIEEAVNDAIKTKNIDLILAIMDRAIAETLSTYLATADAVLQYLKKHATDDEDKKTIEMWVNQLAQQTAKAFNYTFTTTKLVVLQ